MKRKMLLFLCTLFSVICCAFGFAACGENSDGEGNGGNGGSGTEQGGNTQKPNDGSVGEKVIDVESVALNKNLLTLEVGDTYTLTASVLPSDATDKSVTWESSDSDKVTVANGKITAVSAGEVTVTVTTVDGNKTAECVITVNEPVIRVESVELNETSLILKFGEDATLSATVLPDDAENKNVIWTSSDEDVVTVKDGKVSAVDSGKAKIIVTTVDGNKTAECEVTVKSLKYAENVVDGKAVSYSVIGIGTVTDKQIIIPDEHNGKKVTAIAKDAFKNCTFITDLVIPDTITAVGGGAFGGCKNLESVTMPATAISSVPKTKLKKVVITGGDSIDYNAFKGVSSLTSVTIPDNIISIGNSAFSGCVNLTDISVGNGIKTIGKGAFENCGKLKYNEYNNALYLGNATNKYVVFAKVKNTSLTSCAVNEKTKAIYDSAFSGCSSITGISIPDGVTSVGYEAFKNCNNLQYNENDNCLYLGNSSNKYVVLIKAKGKININDYSINDKTKVIYDEAFSNCSKSQFTIPEGVVSIGYSVFASSTVKTVKLPDSLLSIGDAAFRSCTNLTSIIIPDGVTYIGEYMFYNCSKLADVTIPDKVKYVARDFLQGTQCKYNEYENGYYYASKTNPYCIWMGLKNTNVTSLKIHKDARIIFGSGALESITVPDNVIYISESYIRMLSYTNLTEITVGEYNRNYYSRDGILYNKEGTEFLCIPKSVKGAVSISNDIASIPDSAFFGCSNLTSITIPEGVTSIGGSAFYGCSSLTSVTIPDGITSIGNGAFDECSSLKSIHIPESVTSIGDFAFSRCSSLESITVAKANKTYHSQNNCLIETAAKKLVSGCKNSVIPDDGSVTSICAGAFFGCDSLTNITIPVGVKSIGSQAFSNTGLVNLTIPDGVTSVGESVFSGCVKLKSISFPDSVNEIGYYLFSTCESLESISVGKGNKTYHSQGNCIIETKSKTLVAACKNSVIPDDGSVISIGFGACHALVGKNEISLPDSITDIGSWAYAYCGASSIVLGNGVSSIGENAFRNCGNLTSITINSGITLIDKYAFQECTNLTVINFKGTKSQWNAINKASGWNSFTGNYTVRCTDGNISKN